MDKARANVYIHQNNIDTSCCDASLLQVKCKRYWPEKTDTTETIGSKFEITVTSFVPYAEYQIRKMQLRSVSFYSYLEPELPW